MLDTGLKIERVLNDLKALESNIERQAEPTADEILNNLLDSIVEIDFKTLAFPELPRILKEMEGLRPLVLNEDGSIITEDKEELKLYRDLLRQLNSFKLTKNHYLVLCIEQLLKIAVKNQWALCKKHGFIYLYNGRYWAEIDKEHFQHFLGNIALRMGVEKFKGKIHTFKDELYKQFLADSYLPTPLTTGKKININLLNGTFEIDGKKRGLRKFDKSDFITYQLPFDYDPDATYPLFHRFLNEVLPDRDKQKVLAEFIGHLFIKSNVLKLEKVLLIYGTGANGKSVFFEIINALLGNQNVGNYSLQSLTNDSGYYRAKIGNKLVNYSSEINGKLETDIFKQMASGEPIEARLPYGEPFILTEYAKLIFNCNELPKDVEHTNAFFRRFIIVNFDVTIPEHEQDKELSFKIINRELSGVFNWVLSGLERLLDQKNFSKCEAIDNALHEYQNNSDSVKMFIDEEGYKRDADNYITIKELYPMYKMFCNDDGYYPVGKSKFMKRLFHHKIFVKRIDVGNVAYIKKDFSNGLDL